MLLEPCHCLHCDDNLGSRYFRDQGKAAILARFLISIPKRVSICKSREPRLRRLRANKEQRLDCSIDRETMSVSVTFPLIEASVRYLSLDIDLDTSVLG